MNDKKKIELLEKQIELLEKIVELQDRIHKYPDYVPYPMQPVCLQYPWPEGSPIYTDGTGTKNLQTVK